MKHHPIRNYHDDLLRKILQPLIVRGYFDAEIDTGSIVRNQEIVYHPTVSHVHLTGGKVAHDAIVWGSVGHQRDKPVLKAQITSELGCVTPWIVAPQEWTPKQLNHQVKLLFASMYSGAGANCNSPKVVILTKDWPHAKDFVKRLCLEMEINSVPLSYYPGAKERWDKFRKAYPDAAEYGDISTKVAKDRQLKATAVLLPWLVVDNIVVDLKTASGRQAAESVFAFRNEPFALVVSIAYVDDLQTAVTLANDYLLDR